MVVCRTENKYFVQQAALKRHDRGLVPQDTEVDMAAPALHRANLQDWCIYI
jgi:hypothetical protein